MTVPSGKPSAILNGKRFHPCYRKNFENLCMKIAYFDCFSGASGDMILGALLDAGVQLRTLLDELAKLPLDSYRVEVNEVVKRGLRASQAVVHIDRPHDPSHHRHLSDITGIIRESRLPPSVKAKSVAVFTRLANAEARVHDVSVEEIHFHEVGAMDAIIDVVGSVVALESLEIDKVVCSPLHLGSGTAKCAHGILPVPAPATSELVRGKPVYTTQVVGELLTPTGAAILTTLADEFGPMPPLNLRAIGCGAGTSDFTIPNVLRIFVGDSGDLSVAGEVDQVAVIETNIDDMNPQIYDHVMDQLFRLGALDAFLTTVQMKKNRPGMVVTVICQPESVPQLADVLIRETTTIGLRWRLENRIKASRSLAKVNTKFGVVRIKISSLLGRGCKISPEYDDCKCIAHEKGIPIADVMFEARKIGSEQLCTEKASLMSEEA